MQKFRFDQCRHIRQNDDCDLNGWPCGDFREGQEGRCTLNPEGLIKSVDNPTPTVQELVTKLSASIPVSEWEKLDPGLAKSFGHDLKTDQGLSPAETDVARDLAEAHWTGHEAEIIEAAIALGRAIERGDKEEITAAVIVLVGLGCWDSMADPKKENR